MADLPPATKLPLAVRKNIRDGYEAKKADNAAQLSKILGVDWTFDIDPLSIYPYAEEGSYGQQSLGDCINSYIEGLIYNLQYFTKEHGQEGIDELNAICPTHTVTMAASTSVSYCGTEIKDGKLILLFHPKNLGTNTNNVSEKLAQTITDAPQPPNAPSLSYAARHSIKVDYTAKIDEHLEQARIQLDNPTFEFQPDFEAVGAKLKRNKEAREDWETNMGAFLRDYFASFGEYLKYEKFQSDDLLREGLAEAVPKGAVRFRIVDKLATSQNGYNEIVLEGDELFIQTTPANFGTNIYNSCAKIVDIL